jgi:hypothetical protein
MIQKTSSNLIVVGNEFIPHIYLVGQSLRKVDFPWLNKIQSSEFYHLLLTYPI